MSIALQNVSGTVRGSDFENDNEGMLWEIEIINSAGQAFDVEVNANTGDVVSQKSADIDEDDEDEDHGDDDHERNSNNENEGPQNEQKGLNNK